MKLIPICTTEWNVEKTELISNNLIIAFYSKANIGNTIRIKLFALRRVNKVIPKEKGSWFGANLAAND